MLRPFIASPEGRPSHYSHQSVNSHPGGEAAIAIGPLGSVPFHGFPAELGQARSVLFPGGPRRGGEGFFGLACLLGFAG